MAVFIVIRQVKNCFILGGFKMHLMHTAIFFRGDSVTLSLCPLHSHIVQEIV